MSENGWQGDGAGRCNKQLQGVAVSGIKSDFGTG